MTFRCATAREERGEALSATASTVRTFLLMEDPGPWGPHVLHSRRLPDAVRPALRTWSRELGLRPLLVRRHGRDRGGPRLVAVVNARHGWTEATTVTDLLAWHRALPAERQAEQRAGMSREREAELLREWHARDGAAAI